MTAESHAEQQRPPTDKEGWVALCDRAPRSKPRQHSAAEIKAMARRERAVYDEQRRRWHANLGPIKTPQIAAVHEELWELLATNQQDIERVRTSAALDADPGVGKTTGALAFGKEFHRQQIDIYGAETSSDSRRLPVAFIQLPATTTTRTFSSKVCQFYAHPGADRGTAAQLIQRAADCVLACETKLLIIDDAHFLNMNRTDGREVVNHFKSLVNTLPVTLLVVGVGLDSILNEGRGPGNRAYAQTSRRLTRLKLSPFNRTTEQGHTEWIQVLKTIEHQLVLANKHEGMLFRDLEKYLFERTGGYFTSLMSLITRSCHRATQNGSERLDQGLLSSIHLDAAAERTRGTRPPAPRARPGHATSGGKTRRRAAA